MKSRVDNILAMDINGDDGDDITFNSSDQPISSPYLSYGTGDAANADDRSVNRLAEKSRPKTGKKKESKAERGGASSDNASYYGDSMGPSSSSNGGAGRPKSATRRKDSSERNAYGEEDVYQSSSKGSRR